VQAWLAAAQGITKPIGVGNTGRFNSWLLSLLHNTRHNHNNLFD
jgi:hypothetical protein